MLIIGLGAIVGAPTLSLTHVGGDDEHLVLNHALVNHPSLPNAVELFSITHRDLYQPIPLLTFQIEFALFAHGADPQEQINNVLFHMHLTNVLLHILNGILIWRLFRRLSSDGVGLIIAALFLVHPLSVESYSWLNGRMTLLSTTFSLLVLILVRRWWAPPPDTPSSRVETLTSGLMRSLLLVVLVAMAHMSKLNAALPLLMLGVAWWSRRRPTRAAIINTIVATAITAGFLLLNVFATRESQMLEGATEQLHGPSSARVVLALGWYLQHYLWPTGLSPHYPPPVNISWSDPAVVHAILYCGIVSAAVLVSLRRTRIGWVGLLWFVIAIAPTLPFVPTRNQLAADRYAYFPNLGLHWIVAAFVVWLWYHPRPVGFVLYWKLIGCGVAVFVVGLLVRIGWITTRYYATPEAKMKRVVEIAPEFPTWLAKLGWLKFKNKDYSTAAQLADKELTRFSSDSTAYALAMSLRAMCRFQTQGDTDGAIADLQSAIQRDPDFLEAPHYLGWVFFHAGRLEQAAQVLEPLVHQAPRSNPDLNLLAQIYRLQGDVDRSQVLYQQSLDNSRGYDLDALLGLADLANSQQRFSEALSCYDRILELNPGHLPALIAASDLLRQSGRYKDASALWERAINRGFRTPDYRARLAYHRWFLNDIPGAQSEAQKALTEGPTPLASLTLLLVDVAQGRPQAIADQTEFLLHQPDLNNLYQYAYEALEFYSAVDIRSPWPYYVTTLLLVREGRGDMALKTLEMFDQLCTDSQWSSDLHRRVEHEIARSAKTAPTPKTETP